MYYFLPYTLLSYTFYVPYSKHVNNGTFMLQNARSSSVSGLLMLLVGCFLLRQNHAGQSGVPLSRGVGGGWWGGGWCVWWWWEAPLASVSLTVLAFQACTTTPNMHFCFDDSNFILFLKFDKVFMPTAALTLPVLWAHVQYGAIIRRGPFLCVLVSWCFL